MKYHKYPVVLAELIEGSRTMIGQNLIVVGEIKIPMIGDFPADDRHWDLWTGLEKSLKDGEHIVALPHEGDLHGVRAIDRVIEHDGD
jgi:hypothetical protein